MTALRDKVSVHDAVNQSLLASNAETRDALIQLLWLLCYQIEENHWRSNSLSASIRNRRCMPTI